MQNNKKKTKETELCLYKRPMPLWEDQKLIKEKYLSVRAEFERIRDREGSKAWALSMKMTRPTYHPNGNNFLTTATIEPKTEPEEPVQMGVDENLEDAWNASLRLPQPRFIPNKDRFFPIKYPEKSKSDINHLEPSGTLQDVLDASLEDSLMPHKLKERPRIQVKFPVFKQTKTSNERSLKNRQDVLDTSVEVPLHSSSSKVRQFFPLELPEQAKTSCNRIHKNSLPSSEVPLQSHKPKVRTVFPHLKCSDQMKTNMDRPSTKLKNILENSLEVPLPPPNPNIRKFFPIEFPVQENPGSHKARISKDALSALLEVPPSSCHPTEERMRIVTRKISESQSTETKTTEMSKDSLRESSKVSPSPCYTRGEQTVHVKTEPDESMMETNDSDRIKDDRDSSTDVAELQRNLQGTRFFPMKYPEQPKTNADGVFKIFDEDGNCVQRCNIKKLDEVEKLPPIKYFTYTDRNVASEDEKVLSHIPYTTDDPADQLDGNELINHYESIHGYQIEKGIYMTDWILYHMLKDLEPLFDRENRDRMILYNTMYYMFPNKLSADKLKNIMPSLTARFADDFGKSKGFDRPDSHSFNQNIIMKFCIKCKVYGCSVHGVLSEKILNEVNGIDTVLPWQMPKTNVDDKKKKSAKTNTMHRCGPLCYKRFSEEAMTDVGDIRLLNEENLKLIDETIQDLLKRDNVGFSNCCTITHTVNRMLMNLGELKDRNKVSCRRVYKYVRTKFADMITEAPVQSKVGNSCSKKKKTDIRRARYRLPGSDRVRISNKFKPCDHPGRDCKMAELCKPGDETCACLDDRNVCTKYCSCDCAHKFPGCKCTSGCRTSVCPCYLANFECDPDVCTGCGIDKALSGNFKDVTCTNLQIQMGYKKNLTIKISEIPNAGWGLFVLEDVKRGELLSEYCGEIISQEECDRRGHIYDLLRCSYTFTLNNSEVIDATRLGNLARFANHADSDYNAYTKIMVVDGAHRIGLYAYRDLEMGEEIVFDYKYDEAHKQFVCKKRAISEKEKKPKGGKCVKAKEECKKEIKEEVEAKAPVRSRKRKAPAKFGSDDDWLND